MICYNVFLFMKYLSIALFLILSLFIYFQLAEYYRIVDYPLKRSSHSKPTIRGGGIIFPLAVILWFLFFGFKDIWFVTGLMIISIVSFIDDLKNISWLIRFSTHIIAVAFFFAGSNLFSLTPLIWIPVCIVTIGWINIFNFMDGINGITAFYSLVCLVTFLFFSFIADFTGYELPIVMIITVLIFGFFNARRNARIFAGDVGSIPLAYMLAFMMIRLISETGRIEYLLFFSVYGIDGAVSILFRIIRGENIFEAHRTHLYQFMSNELSLGHIKTAGLYAITQLSVNILTILLVERGIMNIIVFFSFLSILLIFYLTIRLLILTRIKRV